MTGFMKTALTVLALGMLVFFTLAVSMAVAIATGLYVDHGQDMPGGFTATGLTSLGAMLLGGVMAGVDALATRLRGGAASS